MKKIWTKALAYVLAVTMCLSAVNVPVYAQGSTVTEVSTESETTSEAVTEEVTVSGNDAEPTTEEVVSTEEATTDGNDGSTWDQVTTENVYEGENYKVTFALTSNWDAGYNANVKLENTGDTTIQNWYLGFDYNNSITNIWNAEVSSNEGNEYVIKNVGWNQDIAAGNSIEFGLSGDHAFKGFPENYELIGTNTEVTEDDYAIQYIVDGDWGTGFYGSISVTNNTDTALEDWVLEFDFDREITEIWNGVIEEHEGNHYVVRNAEYNSTITPGENVSIGIKGCGGEAGDEPENYKLFSFNDPVELDILSVSKEMMILNDGHYNLDADFSMFYGELKRAEEVTKFVLHVYDKNQILIYETDIAPEQQWKTDNIALIYGINRIVFEAYIGTGVDVEEFTIECKDNYNFNKLNLDLNDTDGDGLQNYFELYFETDVNLKDTDGDGLNDYQELYELGYDALSIDTDGDGILDCDEDEDEDGINNKIEYDLGSSPLDIDSDNDKLDDKIEMEYGTSLIEVDTDEDGITDYEEYYMKKMNASFNSSNNMYTVEFSADEMGILYDKAVIPSIKLTADATGIMSFAIERVESNYMLNPFMVGYMGAAYDFTTEGNMLEAELTFTYNETLIDDDMINSQDFCPTIYYYNPTDGTLSEVEGQTWTENKVSVKLEHFSTYILVNKTDMERFWNETVEIEEGSNIASGNHVVFVMDRSGSMASNDRYFIRTSLVREFWNKMGKNDKIGLVGFANSGIKYSDSLTNDVDVIESAIGKFENQSDSGGTYMNKGIEAAVELLNSATDENVKKSIFILTDGYTSDRVSSTYLAELVENDITIYTVGMGSVSQSYLQSVATSTGGKYFYARTSSDLSEIFIDFEDEIDYDKNNDGLNDELTKLICKGEITTYTDTKVFCSEKSEASWEEMYKKIMESDDLDEDGLKNGEEIEIYFIGEKPYINFISNPEIIDTDCDLMSDYEEIKINYTNPQEADFVVDSTDYMYLNGYMNFESGKAFDAYLSRSDFEIVSEYLFNVIICGGEAQINKTTRMELLDLFVSYADQNSEQLSGSGVLNVANAYLRGILDLIPGLGLEAERYVVNQKINNIQQQILSLRGVDYSKAIKKLLKKDIKELNSMFSKHADKASKFSKYGGYIGLGVTAIATSFQSFEEFAEYSASLEVVCNYENILNELKYCGDENIEYAAQKVSEDMQSVIEKYKTGGANFVLNLGYYGSTAYASYLIAGMGPVGLAVDLVWLASDVVVGDALSAKINNFVTVECANGVAMATNNVFSGAKYQADANGKVIIVNSGDEKSLSAINMIDINTFARQWMETKYLSYLQDESWFFDADHFLYKEDDSEEKAQSNITKLTELSQKY